jgi:hypothetical protein
LQSPAAGVQYPNTSPGNAQIPVFDSALSRG